MHSLRRILVAIKYPALRSQPAITKAAQLAAATGATLELHHVLASLTEGALSAIEGFDTERFQRERESLVRMRLEEHAATLAKQGIRAEVSWAWDYPAHEGIIRRAVKTRADLIVAGRHPEQHVAPWLLSYIDWELLRLAPMPVLLVKSELPYRQPIILAALDPTHAHAKPANVDAEILGVAAAFREALGGTLHAMHSCVSLPIVVNRALLRDPEAADRLLVEAAEDANAAFKAVIRDAGIEVDETHFVNGVPSEAIPEIAGRINGSIVAMGAVSRSGLRRFFIGNTAEQVLGKLGCDVLIVKPEGFRTPVSSKPNPGILVDLPVAPV